MTSSGPTDPKVVAPFVRRLEPLDGSVNVIDRGGDRGGVHRSDSAAGVVFEQPLRSNETEIERVRISAASKTPRTQSR